jgi:cyclic beta-1,2-glucan synthetase
MVDRFHADPVIATGELLLDERAPERAPAEWPLSEADDVADGELALPHPPGPWASADPSRPQAFVLGNGRLTSLVTDSGGGGLAGTGCAHRYQPTPRRRGRRGSTCGRSQPAMARHLPQAARATRCTRSSCIAASRISVHVDVAVAAADDVEVVRSPCATRPIARGG